VNSGLSILSLPAGAVLVGRNICCDSCTVSHLLPGSRDVGVSGFNGSQRRYPSHRMPATTERTLRPVETVLPALSDARRL
jgi:hypothetical protein